jgi:hypothetical protein
MMPMSLLALVLLAAGDEPAAIVDPTKAALVKLDFRGRSVGEVARAIGERGGSPVELLGGSFPPGPDGGDKKITIEAPEPVPFWEAIDRLCAEAGLQRSGPATLPFGQRQRHIQLHGPAGDGDPGPAQHVGPFRFGRFALHAHYTRVYVPEPNTPSGPGPFFAEFQVLVEPRIIAVRTGPVRGLEVVDEQGRSLVDPAVAAGKGPEPPSGYDLNHDAMVRIPLVRPESPGRRLRRLKGVMPVEVGVRPAEPDVVVAAGEAAGKTFRVGDMTVKVGKFDPGTRGAAALALTAQIEGERGDVGKVPAVVLSARVMNILYRQIEIVDARGEPVRSLSGGAFPRGNLLTLNYTLGPQPGQPGLRPAKLRIYAPKWVAWDAPFEWADLPLP